MKKKKTNIFVVSILVLFLTLGVMVPTLWAAEEIKITPAQLLEQKKLVDDPRPYLESLAYKKILPPELYAKLTFNIEEMKKLSSECVGFKAPDVVGKIAPEIKPGTYSYKDKEKYPGFKELMTPDHYKRFNPGAPPLAGNFPVIKVVPTRQYYWSIPIAEATKKYSGKTKLGDNGLLKEETWTAGYPFPKPEGKFKANQIIYNWLKKYTGHREGFYQACTSFGFNSSLREDNFGLFEVYGMRQKGRVEFEPLGVLDERTEKQTEDFSFIVKFDAPRDMFGNVVYNIKYWDPDKFDQTMLYINALRRVRLMSTTDIQDAVGGSDTIYCDSEYFSQKLSEKIFPYKCEVIAEREYLVPIKPQDGSGYMSSKGCEFHNYEYERRPMYVVKMTQLDRNFVYSYRILYIDKETFILRYIENYDQKGRLYRSVQDYSQFVPEMGMTIVASNLARDHIDKHSTWVRAFNTPAPWVSRHHVSMSSIIQKGK